MSAVRKCSGYVCYGCLRQDYCYDSNNVRLYLSKEKFEDVDMEVQGMNKHVGIYVDGNKVIEVNLETGKEGVARCHPDDDFDFYIGAKLALERLEDAEKPYAWLKLGVRYYVPDTIDKGLFQIYVYDASDWAKRAMKRGIVFQTKEEAIECAKKMLAAVKQEG